MRRIQTQTLDPGGSKAKPWESGPSTQQRRGRKGAGYQSFQPKISEAGISSWFRRKRTGISRATTSVRTPSLYHPKETKAGKKDYWQLWEQTNGNNGCQPCADQNEEWHNLRKFYNDFLEERLHGRVNWDSIELRDNIDWGGLRINGLSESGNLVETTFERTTAKV